MSESFGARLRQRREAQGIALERIASETKVKLSLLQALERDDLSHWPGGLFRRAFVRAYAQAIGLDPDATVRELLAAHTDPSDGIDPVQMLARNGDGHRPGGAPPTRLHTMLDSAFQSLSGRRHGDVSADEPRAPQPAPDEAQREVETVADTHADAPNPPASNEPDLQAFAELCTALGRVESADEFPPLLAEAARILSMKGLIVWLWDELASELKPVLAHGYSEETLARLPGLTFDSDNATAAAFRSGQACTVNGDGHSSAALVVPLLMPAGCAGALALEFEVGVGYDSKTILSIRAMATIIAALLAQLVGGQPPVASRNFPDARSRESA